MVLFIMGIVTMVGVILAYLYPRLRLVEEELPDAGMKDNFVITTIADRDVNSLDDFMNLIASRSGKGTLVEGIYPDGEQAMYAISF